MKLEAITLNKYYQTEKDKYHRFLSRDTWHR